MNIYVNGIPLEEVYYEIENSFCQECAYIARYPECDECCDDYHLYCGECV